MPKATKEFSGYMLVQLVVLYSSLACMSLKIDSGKTSS